MVPKMLDLIVQTDDCNTPLIVKIMPPPLHTVLLVPVNHVIDNLRKYYPAVDNMLENLYIKLSNYHLKKYKGNQCNSIL